MRRKISTSPIGSADIPGEFALHQNYPNPFNPATKIRFEILESTPVRLIVYNNSGREVARLVDRVVDAGYHRAHFNAAHPSSGIYLYRLTAGGFSKTARMLLVK